MARKRNILIHHVNEDKLKRFGQLLRLPADEGKKPDFESDIITFYGQLGLLSCEGPTEFGICTYKKRALTIEHLEQHGNTQELLYAIDDDFIIPVAPPLNNAPDLDNMVAIRVHRSEGIIFEKGIWHWVPYPLKDESFALVGFAKDTAKNDLVVFDLDEQIVMVTE